MSSATAASAAPGSRVSAVRGAVLVAAARLATRLPEAPLVAGADAAGELWYRLAPARAAQARANLGRVAEHLAAAGRGSTAARRAATDPEMLERLVRAAFRHAVRYYLEVARTAAFDLPAALERIVVDTPAEVEEAFAEKRPIIILGAHFGSLELPVVYIASRVGRAVTAPMETVSDPGLQRWMVASRSRVGVTIIPLEDSRRRLLADLRSGWPVGLVVDRDVAGGGYPVPFFGHPAPIPAGPALLALETGADVYVGGARRTRDRRYRGRLVRVLPPGPGSRRERVTAMTASIATALESIIGDAPEQWWGAFQPIWPDLALRDLDDEMGGGGDPRP